MRPAYEYGEAVRVVRNVRNDGTFPGLATGKLLIRSGSVGYVRDVGTFLQDQIIYSVDFMEERRVIGCREQELQPASEPWIPTRFEFHDKVTPRVQLAVRGEVLVRPGDCCEVDKVIRDHPDEPAYYIRYQARTYLVLESALEAFEAVEQDEVLQ